MKNTIMALILLAPFYELHAQTAEEYFDRSLSLAKERKIEEAIPLMNESIKLDSSIADSWYLRGLMKMQLANYEHAIPDFEKAEMLGMRSGQLYINKGLSKRSVTDYEGAMGDFNLAIARDEKNGEGWYQRGALHLLLGTRDSACADFNKALSLGYQRAKNRADNCKEPPGDKVYPILRLTQTATNKKYGFDEKILVKVGTGPEGGPANQRAYLELLRDVNGKPLQYERVGSCCYYESKNALFGDHALADRYIIKFTDEQGKPKEAMVHITFYDYEEPKILYGFTTVKPVKDSRK